MSRDIWAAEPESSLQALTSKWLGALQRDLSRESKVKGRVLLTRSHALNSCCLTGCSPGWSSHFSWGSCKRSRPGRPVFRLELSRAHSKSSCHCPSQSPMSLLSICRIISTQVKVWKSSLIHSNPDSCRSLLLSPAQVYPHPTQTAVPFLHPQVFSMPSSGSQSCPLSHLLPRARALPSRGTPSVSACHAPPAQPTLPSANAQLHPHQGSHSLWPLAGPGSSTQLLQRSPDRAWPALPAPSLERTAFLSFPLYLLLGGLLLWQHHDGFPHLSPLRGWVLPKGQPVSLSLLAGVQPRRVCTGGTAIVCPQENECKRRHSLYFFSESNTYCIS